MKQKLLALLELLEREFPPLERGHHCIIRNLYGSDESGWQEQLGLVVWQGDYWRTFFLDDEDFEKPAEQLVAEICALAASLPIPEREG